MFFVHLLFYNVNNALLVIFYHSHLVLEFVEMEYFSQLNNVTMEIIMTMMVVLLLVNSRRISNVNQQTHLKVFVILLGR